MPDCPAFDLSGTFTQPGPVIEHSPEYPITDLNFEATGATFNVSAYDLGPWPQMFLEFRLYSGSTIVYIFTYSREATDTGTWSDIFPPVDPTRVDRIVYRVGFGGAFDHVGSSISWAFNLQFTGPCTPSLVPSATTAQMVTILG